MLLCHGRTLLSGRQDGTPLLGACGLGVSKATHPLKASRPRQKTMRYSTLHTFQTRGGFERGADYFATGEMPRRQP